jgi:hypothetical protein
LLPRIWKSNLGAFGRNLISGFAVTFAYAKRSQFVYGCEFRQPINAQRLQSNFGEGAPRFDFKIRFIFEINLTVVKYPLCRTFL